MVFPTLERWIAEGPFTLALSSSFFGFFSHSGVTAALIGRGHLPRKITGSSAGALVGAALASGFDPDSIRNLLFGVKREHFWDPRPGLGYLKGEKFLRLLEENFVASFEHAKIPFEAAAFDLFRLRTCFLEQGSLPRAVLASCAVPLLFHPVRIGSSLFVDGGLFHKSGISPSSLKERVLCVFLQGDGLSDAYELQRSLGRLGAEHKVIRFKSLPRLNYSSLERGKTAYEEAYRRTQEAMGRKLSGPILEA
jgi:NTE family protein